MKPGCPERSIVRWRALMHEIYLAEHVRGVPFQRDPFSRPVSGGMEREYITGIDYWSVRPMSIIAWRTKRAAPGRMNREPRDLEMESMKKFINRCHWVSKNDTRSPRWLATVVFKDRPANEVAAMLAVPGGTVSAWRAHETRGTYAEAASV